MSVPATVARVLQKVGTDRQHKRHLLTQSIGFWRTGRQRESARKLYSKVKIALAAVWLTKDSFHGLLQNIEPLSRSRGEECSPLHGRQEIRSRFVLG